MIDTIFYFVRDFDTYKQKLDNNEILAKTIVFVEDQKAIYKNGVRYGSMSTTDIRNEIANIINGDQVILNIISLIYDDAWIRTEIDRIQGVINGHTHDLQDIVNNLDADIQDKVEDLLKDSTWLRNNVNQNELFQQSMHWDDNVGAYLLQLGIWRNLDDNIITQLSTLRQSVEDIEQLVGSTTEYPDGKIDALLSALNLQVDPLTHEATSEISSLYAEINKAKEVIEWMYSGLKTSTSAEKTFANISSAGKNGILNAISDLRTSVDNIGNTYVAKSNLTSQVKNTKFNITSTGGIVNEVSLDAALSTVFAAINDPSNGINGYSHLATTVSNINGNYVAKGSLITEIQRDLESNDGTLKTILSTAGFISQTNVDEAVSRVLANVDWGTTVGTAGLENRVQTIENDYVAYSSLYSTLDGRYALVGTYVLKDANTNKITSDIVLSADHVSIDADVISAPVNSMLTGGNASFYGNVQAKQFIAGGTNEAGIVIQAGSFNSNGADTSKVYIAYDPSQNSPNMFVYNPSNNQWMCLSFTNAFKYDIFTESRLGQYNSSNVIPSNTTLLNLNDFTSTTAYINQSDGKYYTSQSTATTVSDGNYFNWTGIYKELTEPYSNNNYAFQYLYNKNGTKNPNKVVVAAINIVVGIYDKISISGGRPSITNGSDFVYSPNAILSYSTDANGLITNVLRGDAFLKGIRIRSSKHDTSVVNPADDGFTDVQDINLTLSNGSESYYDGYTRTGVTSVFGTLLMPDNKVYDITRWFKYEDDVYKYHGVDMFISGSYSYSDVLMFLKVNEFVDSNTGYGNTRGIITSFNNISTYDTDFVTSKMIGWEYAPIKSFDLSKFSVDGNDYTYRPSDTTHWEDMTYLYTATAAA